MSCRPSNMLGWAVAELAVGCVAGAGFTQSIPLTPTAQASGAVITHEQGIEFVTIGSPGNAAYQGEPSERNNGRGRVDYEYRIGRMEVTTGQWVEFLNAAFDRPVGDDLIPHLSIPQFWGGVITTPQNPGRFRFIAPAGSELMPVGDLSWRAAAIYCNWLHNDRRITRDAFLDGAYDTRTFYSIGLQFQDQFSHHAGARFWIPTLDEWIKAAHYDPNRHGPGRAGYWPYSTTAESFPAYGPPGFGSQANGVWNQLGNPDYDPFIIPLGAYPLVQSPWGLLDAAGGSSEWTEGVIEFPGEGRPRYRINEGTYRGGGAIAADRVGTYAGGWGASSESFNLGFRIAAAVPSPGTGAAMLVISLANATRRRRTHEQTPPGHRCSSGGGGVARKHAETCHGSLL